MHGWCDGAPAALRRPGRALRLGCGLAMAAAALAPAASLAQPGLRFEPVRNELTAERMGATGSAWTDVDGDGLVDVALSARDSMPSRVYRNRGGGSFERIALAVDLRHDANASAWGDVDGDGDPDLVLAQDAPVVFTTTISDGTFRLERAADAGVLTGESRPVGGYEAIAHGDLDGDGDLDLAGGTWGWYGVVALVNDGAGRFAVHPRDDFPFRSSTGGAHLVDLDGDARPDLVFTGTQQPEFRVGSLVYWNTPGGWVADRAQPFSTQPRALGSSIADVDHDGDLDVFVAGWRDSASVLYLNQGGRRFRASALPFPARVVGSAFGDVDNDGDLDLVTGSGYTDVGSLDVFLGDGAGGFARVDVPGFSDVPGKYTGVVLVDYDGDGRLDVHAGSMAEPARLFRNMGEPSGRWLQVELRPAAGGVPVWGAVVDAELETPRGIRTTRVSLHQQTGYAGHGEPVAHFGIPAGARVRSVRVTWPGGARTVVERPEPGRRVRVDAPARTRPPAREGAGDGR